MDELVIRLALRKEFRAIPEPVVAACLRLTALNHLFKTGAKLTAVAAFAGAVAMGGLHAVEQTPANERAKDPVSMRVVEMTAGGIAGAAIFGSIAGIAGMVITAVGSAKNGLRLKNALEENGMTREQIQPVINKIVAFEKR